MFWVTDRHGGVVLVAVCNVLWRKRQQNDIKEEQRQHSDDAADTNSEHAKAID